MTQFAPVNAPSSSFIRADIILVILTLILGFGFVNFLKNANTYFSLNIKIDQSIFSLPAYALLSFTRSLIALALSYIFAIIYGSFAARSKFLEKLLIPMLDILQSLPVIAFLPGFVLALISIFHNSRWGLELSCILTIFTGQVWNLAFAYYESQRTLKPEFIAVAQIYRFSRIKRFFLVDLPNGYRPLIYNGMLSMAGGWFFLTTCEDFSLGNKNFILPGLGSYLSETFAHGAYINFTVGLITLLLLIIGTDIFLWKPIIAWINRFRDSEDDKQSLTNSWFLTIIRNTNFPKYIEFMQDKIYKLFFMKRYGKISIHLDSSIYKRYRQLKPYAWYKILAIFVIFCFIYLLIIKVPSVIQNISTLNNNDWLTLIKAVIITGIKVFLVLIISTLWALPLGLYLGLNPKLERIFQPIIQNLAAFPAPVIFPLITMCLISSMLPNFLISIILMCIGSQWYVLFNILAGASKIPAELKLVAQIYKLNFYQKLIKLYLPAIFPSLSTAWITAAGGAWNASMVAEIVFYPGGIFRSKGIGAELMHASASGNYIYLIAAIICIVILLVIINRTIWRFIHKYSERVKAL